MAQSKQYYKRCIILALAGIFAICQQSWFVVLFLWGLGLADYDLQQNPKEPILTTHGDDNQQQQQLLLLLKPHKIIPYVWWGVLVLSIYITTWPGCFEPFSKHKVIADVWWLTVAGCGSTTAIYHLPVIRRLLETPTMLYLGKISFPLYLVHLPIKDLVWWPYARPFIRNLLLGFPVMTFCVETGLETLTVIAAAHLFEGVENKVAVRGSRRIHAWFSADEGPDSSLSNSYELTHAWRSKDSRWTTPGWWYSAAAMKDPAVSQP